jgi:hypothetical protein
MIGAERRDSCPGDESEQVHSMYVCMYIITLGDVVKYGV